jgi:tetratricopeptide (TPR) repeat protein
LIPTSADRALFEKNMFNAIEICEKNEETDYKAEYLLSNIGARGLLLLFYADNGLTRDVMSVASSTYQYVKQSFDYTKTYADFYFITGLYNYYREAYPEAHPVYKPVALLFPKGDKARGLKEMQIASKNAIVLKAEAYSFLSGIYISYENNFQQAYQYSKALHELYPNNIQYIATYIKNLLLVKNYTEAENAVKNGRTLSDNAYFQAQLNILNGIIYEKKHHNIRQAQYYYGKGVKDLNSFGTIGEEFIAYGYFGLSRMSQDKQQKKEYRKLAMELANFKNVNFDK